MYDNPLLLRLRSITRRTGINKLVGRVVGLFGYERAFASRILSEIQKGDCVWDVGANLGIYSALFLDRVSPGGRVVAFEPSSECFSALSHRMTNREGFFGINAGLGSKDGVSTLFCAVDPLAATHTLSADAGQTQAHMGASYEVRIHSADSFLAQNRQFRPNVIKIDVEGFEADVIQGMEILLSDKSLRSVFIEVHFTLLEAQGKRDAPQDIVARLVGAGFRVTWPDPSHIAAVRRS